MKGGPAIVGIDTGGTFTDFVAFVDGTLRTHKVLSTPHNPAVAVLRGLQDLLPATGPCVVTYGSTVATNTLLERTGARVVLLTTAGFEDLLDIGRQNRPLLYDLEPFKPAPVVPRRRRIGLRERVAADGTVLVPLAPATLRAAIQHVRRLRPDAVAVCLLNAYVNPRHERAVGAALAATGVHCSLSHQLVAEYREYERLSTTVMNAYVGPVMSRHLHDLAAGLAGRRHTQVRVMQSNGGAMSPRVAGREAIRTALSGPAGGVIGAWSVARDLGLSQVITFDMGGTSTDVSLIDGAVSRRSEWTIADLPLKVPAIDIHTVGSGGGSIAWLDAGGALKVGPQSAAADPGPACYGRGDAATVTDANLVLGRLVAGAFLGGRMPLDVARARTAVECVGGRAGLSAERAAAGIVAVVNASMERAVRRISVERGHDPRDYTVVAFGGAAGQHACELAAALGVRRVVIPRHPGLLSAWGAATADVQRDYVRTVLRTAPGVPRMRQWFDALERAARRELRAEGGPAGRWRFARAVDVRYRGQSYELTLPLRAGVVAAFHAAHRRRYGYADPDRPVEVVNLRLRAVVPGRRPRVTEASPAAAGPRLRQRVWWMDRWVTAAVRARTELAPRRAVVGPALIAEFSATTFVPPGWRARLGLMGHVVLTHAD
jgi:N-methylhydantoinase A